MEAISRIARAIAYLAEPWSFWQKYDLYSRPITAWSYKSVRQMGLTVGHLGGATTYSFPLRRLRSALRYGGE